MGKQVDNTFTWVIKNFSSMQAHDQKFICSKEFVVGGCKWYKNKRIYFLILFSIYKCEVDIILTDSLPFLACRRLIAYPEVDDYLSLSVYLYVPDCESLPSGWKRHAKYSLAIVNQLSENLCQQQGYYFLPTACKVGIVLF